MNVRLFFHVANCLKIRINNISQKKKCKRNKRIRKKIIVGPFVKRYAFVLNKEKLVEHSILRFNK